MANFKKYTEHFKNKSGDATTILKKKKIPLFSRCLLKFQISKLTNIKMQVII